MRSFLLSFIFLAAINLFAPNLPTDFVEVPWGATKETAKHILLKRAGVALGKETSDLIQFTGGEWAGHKVSEWVLDFSENQLYQGTIYLEEAGGKKLFDSMSAVLKQKYGSAPSERGKSHVSSSWRFKDTPGSKGDKSIMLWWNTKTNTVRIAYKNQAFKPPLDKKVDEDL